MQRSIASSCRENEAIAAVNAQLGYALIARALLLRPCQAAQLLSRVHKGRDWEVKVTFRTDF
jgi:hypothetical protein